MAKLKPSTKPPEKQFKVVHMYKIPGSRKAIQEEFTVWGSHAFIAEAGEVTEDSVFSIIGTDGTAVFTCPSDYIIYCREVGSENKRQVDEPVAPTLQVVSHGHED